MENTLSASPSRDKSPFPFDIPNLNVFDYILEQKTNLTVRDFIGNSKITNDYLDEILKEGVIFPDLEDPGWSKDALVCKICKIQLDSDAELRKHLQTKHAVKLNASVVQNAQKGGGVFTPKNNICKHCKRGFKVKTHFMAHSFLQSHVQCLFCNEKFPCIGLWSDHCMVNHLSKNNFSLVCLKCSQELSSRHNLLCHYATHLAQTYVCIFCDQRKVKKSSYKTLKGLASHFEHNHSEECDAWKNTEENEKENA